MQENLKTWWHLNLINCRRPSFGDNVNVTFITAKNPVILSNFLVWKFCGKVQFPHKIIETYENYSKFCNEKTENARLCVLWL